MVLMNGLITELGGDDRRSGKRRHLLAEVFKTSLGKMLKAEPGGGKTGIAEEEMCSAPGKNPRFSWLFVGMHGNVGVFVCKYMGDFHITVEISLGSSRFTGNPLHKASQGLKQICSLFVKL